MKDKINSISSIWFSNKKENIEECSKKILDFLLLLKKHNTFFSQWYEKSTSKKKALECKVQIEQDYFERALEKKWNKEDLSTRISYWTGNIEDNKSAEISFNVGAYGNKPFNKNSCVLTLPENDELYNSQKEKEELIRLMTDYWKPDRILINGEDIECTR